jgi:single-strand DNA-binding protein
MNIVGRITRNAQINTLKNDKKVVNFSIAINHSYMNKQKERVEQTTFYNCSYWLSTNVAKILTKGALVELTGRVSSSAWIGKDGEIMSSLNFHTSNIILHGAGKKNDNIIQSSSDNSASNSVFDDAEDDDLPF